MWRCNRCHVSCQYMFCFDCDPMQAMRRTYNPWIKCDYCRIALKFWCECKFCSDVKAKTCVDCSLKYCSYKIDEEKKDINMFIDRHKKQHLNGTNKIILLRNRERLFKKLKKCKDNDYEIKKIVYFYGQLKGYCQYRNLSYAFVDDFIFVNVDYFVCADNCSLRDATLGPDKHYLKYKSFRYLNAICFLLLLQRQSIWLPKDIKKLIFYKIYKKKRKKGSGRSRRCRRFLIRMDIIK